MNVDLGSLVEPAWRQLWQVTLVAMVVGSAATVFFRRRPHWAHVLWLLVVIKCLTPPVWSSPTGVFSWATAERAAATETGGEATAARPGTSPRLVVASSDETKAAGHIAASEPGPDSPVETAGWGMAEWLFTAWIGGAACYLLLTLAAGLAWLARIGRSEVDVEPDIVLTVARLSRRLGIRRDVRLRVTAEPIGPAVCGLFRPTIVLPRALLTDRTADQLEPILAHELIHVRRRDGWVCLAQWLAQAAWWFHPLVWWTSRQLSRCREHCCDKEVLVTIDCEPADYAKALLDLLKLRHTLRPRLAFPAARPAEVTMKRLENIMDQTRRFSARTPRWCWVLLAAGLFVVLPGAGLTGNDGTPPAALTKEDEKKSEEKQASTGLKEPSKEVTEKSSKESSESPDDSSTSKGPADSAASKRSETRKSLPEAPPDTRKQRPMFREPVETLPDGLARVTGPIRPFDLLYIRALGTLLDQPIDDYYLVGSTGQLSLGPAYGSVDLAGVELDQTNALIEKHLRSVLARPEVKVKRKGRITQWLCAVVPKAPYRIKIGDRLHVNVRNTLLNLPINGDYEVEESGSIDLAFYGDPVVKGQTFDEAEATILKLLKKTLHSPEVAVTMPQWILAQAPLPKRSDRVAPGDLLKIDVLNTLLDAPIADIFVIEPAGTVQLGPAYGRVSIGGMTLHEAEKAIEKHLKQVLIRPQVAVSWAGWKRLDSKPKLEIPDGPFSGRQTAYES